MARPLVVLLSDFGTRDHYVGTMKAVMLGICPDVTMVDITHDIPPHDIQEAALELSASYSYFPNGTVFLVVVDPGVGSSRRGLVVDTGDYRFVAPDNGVLTEVLRETPPKRMVAITERRYARPTVSRTFEGRDRFAPAAAWLAKGVQLSAFGRTISEFKTFEIPVPEVEAERISGCIIRVDRFGNLLTNITRKLVERFSESRVIQIKVGEYKVDRLVATYAEIESDEPCALFGSTDHLEVAARSTSARDLLGLDRGAPVLVTRE